MSNRLSAHAVRHFVVEKRDLLTGEMIITDDHVRLLRTVQRADVAPGLGQVLKFEEAKKLGISLKAILAKSSRQRVSALVQSACAHTCESLKELEPSFYTKEDIDQFAQTANLKSTDPVSYLVLDPLSYALEEIDSDGAFKTVKRFANPLVLN